VLRSDIDDRVVDTLGMPARLEYSRRRFRFGLQSSNAIDEGCLDDRVLVFQLACPLLELEWVPWCLDCCSCKLRTPKCSTRLSSTCQHTGFKK
jgi:hypothetical protein